MFNPLVSIIIRTKNEENWINSCLEAVFKQTYKKIEVIIVDNYSKDSTLKKAKKFPVKIVKIKKFLPGKAINLGINNSKGQIIVCLSGHCIPVNNNWLWNLIKDLKSDKIAGVYGRQEPLSFSSDLDKRDLLTIFGLDKKIQVNDSFFHNAHSAIKKSIWKKIPFNDEIIHIEDRYWGEAIIKSGLRLVYEPKASVYHWHGVNHDLNNKRAKEIVALLEQINHNKKIIKKKNIENFKILAIIPKKGKTKIIDGKPLLSYTIKACLNSKYVNDVIVSTDVKETADIAKTLGAKSPFLRPKEFSTEYTHILDVIQYTYEKVDNLKNPYDLVVILEETYPLRTSEFIDKVILEAFHKGTDTIVAGLMEERAIWEKNKDSNELKIIHEGIIPRKLKKIKTIVNLFGLCCVTHPSNIKSKNIFSQNTTIYEIDDPIMSLEANDNNKFNKKFKKLLKLYEE